MKAVKIWIMFFSLTVIPINGHTANDEIKNLIDMNILQYPYKEDYMRYSITTKANPHIYNTYINYSEYLGSKISNDLEKYGLNFPANEKYIEIRERTFTGEEGKIVGRENRYYVNEWDGTYFSYNQRQEYEKYMARLALFKLPNKQPLKDKILNQELFLKRILPTGFSVLLLIFFFIWFLEHDFKEKVEEC